MPALIDWLASPTGLRTQAVVALTFQVVGFALVVAEILEARRDYRQMVGRFDEIDNELLAGLQTKLDNETVKQRIVENVRSASGWGKLVALFITPMTQAHVDMATELHAAALKKIHELATRHEGRAHPWRPWVGALFLLLGIFFSFTGQYMGVK
ncbi:hypothetical protein VST63_11190 [Mycolicibacterium sp. 050232]|uniref:hypothetical protein n=1 Tax=Mycolicibacterium sp. 050232 TaxID=3113982 RepID=UPI002E2C0BD5|nr:hypothetical protein [Mycolicibacterium sp. 050232]MED5812925.1 hypothetical protein [Mycolicibacterium sp. 050232]